MERLEKGAATVRYMRTVNGGRLTQSTDQPASCSPMVGLALSPFLSAVVASTSACANSTCTRRVALTPAVIGTTAKPNPAHGEIISIGIARLDRIDRTPSTRSVTLGRGAVRWRMQNPRRQRLDGVIPADSSGYFYSI